jgi:AcrR family transcriptional regulator
MTEDDITKEKIISFCQERFMSEGFARITVDEIAGDLGMSKKTFYKYFTGKEDVVQQIMERIMGNIRANADRILRSDMSAVEKHSEIIATIATNAARLIPVFGADIKKRMPDFWKRIEDFRRQRISEMFNRLIRQGVAEGTMRPDLNQRIFLMCVLSAIDGIMQPQILANESFSVSDAIREILGVFFVGALTQQGRTQFEEIRKARLVGS